ncbi:39S ribosomal protein L22, mitochondrial [Friedmanniomyces endolithicus]|nr:39S ribosomal protein L22, mitochondrial [Friedmanniomyces endolithicus]
MDVALPTPASTATPVGYPPQRNCEVHLKSRPRTIIGASLVKNHERSGAGEAHRKSKCVFVRELTARWNTTDHIAGLLGPSLPFRPLKQHQQRRTAIFGSGGKKADDLQPTGERANPVLEDFKRDSETNPVESQQPQQRPQAGDLSASSIFEDDRRAQELTERYDAEDAKAAEGDTTQTGGKQRNPANMQQVLDPDPRGRERWERRKVIQLVRKGGRLTKQQLIKRTEREHVLRTHNLKTSVKKLGMVARQIAGKTIEDAITQMRFSKKKIAQDVLQQLQYARDEAVVMRGMGLGSVKPEESAGKPSKASVSTSDIANTAPAPSDPQDVPSPVQIQLKDGKRHKVSDPSTIYIDQAWVGRGPFGRLPDYRARGQSNTMRTPWTSLSVVLKEEKTRIRLHEEREEKRKKAVRENVWTHLPDRPVQWQRQWYTF